MSPDPTRPLHEPGALTACPAFDDAFAVEAASSDIRFIDRLLSCSSVVTSPPGEAVNAVVLSPRLGDYDLLRLLGQGGMGLVYEARHRVHQQVVALKTMCYDDPAALARLKREFRLLSDVVNPHLVTLYELCVDGPYCFFTMELIPGVDFLTYVGAGSGLAFDEVRLRSALTQLIEGVSALHQAGRLHRDIKPSNILVRENGQVVLIDFGLAVELHAWRSQGSFEHLAGTLAYMAPERFRRVPVSPASDWYSVGVVLYRALTGCLPYPVDDCRVLLEELEHDPRSPATLNPGVPEDLNELCIDLLKRAPTERPSASELRQRLGPPRVRGSVPSPTVDCAPSAELFVGRDGPLAQMRAGLDSLRVGQPTVILLEGRSGIGKSALMQRFLADLRLSPNVLVLAGRCFEQETVPFKAWDALMEALIRYLCRLDLLAIQSLVPLHARTLTRVFPAFGQIAAFATMPERGALDQDQHELRRRATHALRELLCRLANQKILVLAVDDSHWGDEDSINLLAEILRPPDPPVMLFFASYRAENKKTSPFTQRLLDESRPLADTARQIKLVIDELSPPETEQLVGKLLKQPSDAAAKQIARESGGHPFFVQMLVRHRLRGIQSNGLAGQKSLDALDQVLLAQFQTLPPLERRLLELVSIASGPLFPDVACLAADISSAVGRQAIHALRGNQWLRSEPRVGQEALETYHDRIREVIARHLPVEDWRQLHRLLATVLENAAPIDAERLAVHWFAADEPQRAGGYFVSAAKQAFQALAFHRAAMLYQRGLDLLAADESRRLQLWERVGEARALAGQGAEAARAFLAAADQVSAADALPLRQRAAEQYLKSGHVDVGLEVFRTVMHQMGEHWPTSLGWASLAILFRRSQLWLRGLAFKRRPLQEVSATELTRLDICWTVFAGLSLVDQVRAAYFQVRGVLLALRAGEPFRVARALMSEASHLATAGASAHRRVAALFDEADRLVKEVNTPQARGLLHMVRGIAVFLEGRWHAAWNECTHAVETLQPDCPGTMWEQVTANTFLFWSLTYLGEFAQLRRRFPDCWNEALARGDRYAELNYGTYSMILLRLCEDDEPRGTEELQRLQGQWFQQGFHVQHLNCLWSKTKLDLYAARGTTAWRRLQAEERAVQQSYLLRIQVLRGYHLYLQGTAALAAALQTPQPAEPIRHVKQAIGRLAKEDALWCQALARLLQAGLAALGENQAAGGELYRAAAEELTKVEMHHLAAAARFRQGQYSSHSQAERLREEALIWMRQQTVVNPERLINMYAPQRPS